MKVKVFLPNACSQYGASMGRRDFVKGDPKKPRKVRLTRLRWEDYDYDSGGAYWGRVKGDYIYYAREAANEARALCVFVRAKNRREAKRQVRKQLPKARFVK